jgi:putative transposase
MPRGSNFKRPYPPEFRREAVELYRRSGRPLSEIARDLGVATESLRTWVKRAKHSVSLMCRVLGVSRSGFHAWERRPPSERALVDARLNERIAEVYRRSRDSYSVRRVDLDLRDEGVRVGRKRVERLMRNAGLSGYVKRRKAKTTIRVPGVRVADDLVGRDFNPQAPNRL